MPPSAESCMKLLLVVGCIASIAFEVTSAAVPCRPDFGGCSRPHPPPPPRPVATIYQRALPAPPPAGLDRASITRVLVGSAWTRLGSREQIRFVDPPSAGHFARPPAPSGDRAIRAVMIDMRRDRRTVLVAIDGELYTIIACQLPRFKAPPLTTGLEHP